MTFNAKAFDREFYQQHKDAGLDYAVSGTWQIDYGRWLVEALNWRNKRILDCGCACGAILHGLNQAGANGCGVDVCEHMIQLGRNQWDLDLNVCDLANLHLFENGRFHGLHCAQVAEHWKLELVPVILRELARVTKVGGLFFCCMDTEDFYERNCRENDDPTHYCIQSLDWWRGRFQLAGWKPSKIVLSGDFLKIYNWDYLLMQRL